MASLQQSVNLLGEVRAKNPGLDSLNDQELADLLYQETGDERLRAAQQSSAVGRGINTVGSTFSELGQNTEQFLAPEGSSFPRQVAGRTVGNLVSSAPELGINMASAALRGLPRLAGYGAGALFSYGRTKAETGNDKAALGSAAGSLASLAGGIKGGKVGRALVGPAAGKVGSFLGGAAGSALGSVPGDALEIGTSPGGFEEFLKDPVNLPAYALGQGGVGAAFDLAGQVAENREIRKQKTMAAIPELDSLINKTEQEELAALKAKPVQEKNEMDIARELQLNKQAAKRDDRLLSQKFAKPTPENFSTYPEAPETVREQLRLLNKGKKAVVEIPVGTEPDLDYLALSAFREYTSPTNGNLYLFDETKTTPEIIENSIKTDSLGLLLGYGTGKKPLVPTGKTAVLRSKRGIEKAAVILGDGNETTVLKSLAEMAVGDDVVRVEPMDDVIKWRQKNSGLQKLYSIAGDMRDPQDEISFTNHVLDMFGKALEPKISGFRTKGPRFQVDANAEISTKGLYQAVKDWAPAELLAHYKDKGIETLLNFNNVGKIKAADFTKWIRENTPEVEVKKLLPDTKTPGSEVDRLQHEIEGMGMTLANARGDVSGVDDVLQTAEANIRNGREMNMPNLTRLGQLQLAYREAYSSYSGERMSSDAATGRYGIEPKSLEEMPGAVDILVRVPLGRTLEQAETGLSDQEWRLAKPDDKREILYKGPHFGESDVNVLASVRGYMETLPNGEKAFHVFEVQSDWGQRRAKDQGRIEHAEKQYVVKQDGKLFRLFDGEHDYDGRTYKTKEEAEARRKEAVQHYIDYNHGGQTKDHPLLASYETLALKTAIQHARAEGAKYIAISDAETAMMTEGHDRYTQYDPNTDEKLNIIPQEKGMRAAYDQRLPAIAQKLTRSKGERVEFGQHKVATDFLKSEKEGDIGSPVFKDSKGNSKSIITARLYDISNPAPEVKRLFSLYDADRQAGFEHTLRLENTKRGDGIVSQREVLEKALNGQYSEVEPLLNFLNSIKGTRGVIREGTFLQAKQLGSLNLQTGDIKLNKDISFKVNEAFRLLGHELTHGAIVEMKRTNPEAYKYLIDLVEQIGHTGRQSILQGLKDQLKLGPRFDTKYLSGQGDDFPLDPFYRERTAHEFVAGLAEASAEHFANSQAKPEWYKYLPQPVVAILQKITKTLRKYFGNEFPGVGHMLDASQDHRLRSIVGLMDKHVSETVAANLREVANLQKTSVFDEINFIDSLPAFRQNLANSVQTLRGGEGELYSFAGDMFKKYVGKVDKFYRNWFYNGLFRTRDQPETLEHFLNLHGYRGRTQNELFGYLSQTGQTDSAPLSREQAFERYGKFAEQIADPYNKKGQRWLQIAGDIFAENTDRRENIQGRDVERSDLVSREEMIEKYKITPEEAEFVERYAKIPELVAKEKLRKQSEIDAWNISRLFYRANKGQDMNGVYDKVSRLNRIASDFGAKLFQLETYKKRLAEENKNPEPNLELQGSLGADIQVLEQEKLVFTQLLDQSIRQEFAGSIPIRDGYDSFVAASAEALTRAATQREQYRVMTKDIGYAPMSRRGRFHLKVYDPSILGQEFAKVKEYRGFETKKEAEDYIKKNNIQDHELIDKEDLKERVRLFTPNKIDHVRNKAKQDFKELIERYSRSTEEMDPDQREHLLSVLDDMSKRFQPLEQEYKDVVSVKGDKFKERRYLVPGFDKNDFVPNIIEYADFNTVAINKQWTRAKGEYLLENGKFDSDPELRKRLGDEINYVLSNQTEWNFAKKATFYSYLGLSIRHVLQNALQMPINGISQMVADGHGFASYKFFGKAAPMNFKWNANGTTGDVTIDAMLKQAEREGITVQQSLENPVHDSVELQTALDSIKSQSSGLKLFGQKVNFEKAQARKKLEKFLQSTSTAAESANRKTTFIASILAQRAKGVKDIRTQYEEASRFTNYVNFTGDKANRPGYMIKSGGTLAHGPLVLASLLQSFVLNHVSQLYSFYKKGKQGSVNDKKAFATGLAHLFAFSGAMGLIGAGTAEALFEQFTDVSLKTALREGLVSTFDDDESADALADFVMMGFPGLVGVDLSNSVGLGQPLIRYQAGQPITAEQLGGPFIGLLGRVLDAGKEIKADPFNPQQWWSATRTVAPQFLSQALRAFDVLSSGTVIDKNQQPTGDALGVVGSAAALAGFTPTEVSKQRSFNSEVYKSTKRSSENYETKTRNISKLLHEFNSTGNEDALLKANELFSSYLDSVGGLQDRGSMVNSIAKQLEEFEGKVTQPASLKDLPARQRLERAFPSVKSQHPTDVSSLLKNLEVALSLGQDDVLLQKLQSLPSSLLEAVLSDALTQAGLAPAVGGLLQQPSKLGRLGPNPQLQELLGR